jgi:hypothetical protein
MRLGYAALGVGATGWLGAKSPLMARVSRY